MLSFIGGMTYEYHQSSGLLYLADSDLGRALVARGYAGKADGLNNPDAEHIVRVGPLPRGRWRLGSPIDHPRLGPLSIPLTRAEIPYGRSGFFIHGDNARADFSASSGCIILPRSVRAWVAWSGIRTLDVER